MPDRKPTLLIVDDTPTNIQLLEAILGVDHKIFIATNGLEALTLATAERPDLILMDVLMPVMDGFEACARLKADPRTREIPVIFLTALADHEYLVRGFAAGGIDYVAKPFTPEELMVRVRTHIALKQTQDLERALRLQLEEALAQIKQLSGLLPICAKCKKIRDKQGDWVPMESYISSHSEASFTHGLCSDCVKDFLSGRD